MDEIDKTATGTANFAMISLRLPVPTKKKVAKKAKELGVSQTVYLIQVINEGMLLDPMLEATEKVLRKDPPPFSDEDWGPSRGECMAFIQNAVKDALDKKIAELEGK